MLLDEVNSLINNNNYIDIEYRLYYTIYTIDNINEHKKRANNNHLLYVVGF